MRNWRKDIVAVAPPPPLDYNQPKDKWDVELPWGMPKDAHLMPQHSQDLLRAARSGRIYQKRPVVDEEQDEDAVMAEKPEKKEPEMKDDGFTVKTWKIVPKHLEGPEVEYLAKRRKGLRGAAVKDEAKGPTMTKVTVRKTDSQGNAYVEHVVVPAGQTVEGEVIAQTVVTDPAAVVNEPVKRRPPPPKRKLKGPGRGRKKKLPLPPTSAPTEANAALADGQAPPPLKIEGSAGGDPVKVEATETPSAENEDIEMGDGSQAASDDEGDDGSDDGSEEGEIVEDEEQDDEEAVARARESEKERERMIRANQTSTAPNLPAKPAISDFPMDTRGGDGSDDYANKRRSLGRDLGGSPLKHTLTPRSYSPSVANPDDEPDRDEDDEEPHNGRPSHRGTPFTAQQRESSFEPQHHAEILPNSADNVNEAHDEHEGGEGTFQDMLDENSLDMLLDGGSQDTQLAPDSVPAFSPNAVPEGDEQVTAQQPLDEPENFEDLLGGLESHLNEAEAAASASLLSRSNSAADVQTKDGEEKGGENDGAPGIASVVSVEGVNPEEAKAGSAVAEDTPVASEVKEDSATQEKDQNAKKDEAEDTTSNEA